MVIKHCFYETKDDTEQGAVYLKSILSQVFLNSRHMCIISTKLTISSWHFLVKRQLYILRFLFHLNPIPTFSRFEGKKLFYLVFFFKLSFTLPYFIYKSKTKPLWKKTEIKPFRNQNADWLSVKNNLVRPKIKLRARTAC